MSAVNSARKVLGIEVHGPDVHLGVSEVKDVKRVSIRLNDDMLDLDGTIRVDFKGQPLMEAPVERKLAL